MIYSYFIRKTALPLVSRLTEGRFWDLFREYARNPHESLLSPPPDVVFQKVHALLDHAWRNVPFYRKRLDAAGLAPDRFCNINQLQLLPETTKADISANFPDQISDASQSYKPWRYRSTSGTIERLTVIHDFRKRDICRTTDLLGLWLPTGYQAGMKYLEIPPDICRNVCGTSPNVEPNVYAFLLRSMVTGRILRDPEVLSDFRGLVERQIVQRHVTLASFGDGGAVQSDGAFQEYLDSIQRERPYLVKALPIYLYMLAAYITDHGLTPPRIKGGVMPMGASASPHMKRTIESAFQCTFHEEYGSAELGTFGAECGARSGIHPFASLFYVEVVRNGRPARPGELGKVLITDLSNFAMPFIRYEIGDVATVLEGSCSCGVPDLRINVEGRWQDCIQAHSGELISADAVTDLILSLPGVRLFQLNMDGDEAELQVVPAPGASPDLQKAGSLLAALIGPETRVFTRLVPTILPEPGGKYRLIRNTSKHTARSALAG